MTHFFSSLPHIEDCSKHVRAYLNGVCVIDTRKAKLVWTHPYYPNYYFTAFNPSYLGSPKEVDGGKVVCDINLPRGSKTATLTQYTKGKLADLSTVEFSAMDAWFEEDEEIFIHPKDPYKRVDILQSSRHVQIQVNGVTLADTHHPRLLFETGLPVRTYIPKQDCRMDLWVPSDLKTGCPYKGEAHYYDVILPGSDEKVKGIVWWYPTTTLESTPIQGLVAFYDEKVDVWVDGKKQERPGKKI